MMAAAPKPLPLPKSITRRVELQARLAGITPEQWLAKMATLRLDTDEGTREFFRMGSASAVPGAWRSALAGVPHQAAETHDAVE